MNAMRPSLPPGFESQALLQERDGVELHQALCQAGPVALRVASGAAHAPGLAELSVLASVSHSNLASLVDFGQDPSTGNPWVARQWIEGETLDRWSASHTGRELGVLLIDVVRGLGHLHERGFVHGDVKATNILVDREGKAYLTDFGLTVRQGHSPQLAGSWFHLAPELLAGDAHEAASDFFALGAMLHGLLLQPQISASAFYGRFPSTDYFQATKTRVDDLPSWSRALVAELLDRDPSKRPPSAFEVESSLRRALGLPAKAEAWRWSKDARRWSPFEGRESWLDEQDWRARESTLLQLPRGDSPAQAAAGLRLWFTLRGESAALAELSALRRACTLEGGLGPKLDAIGRPKFLLIAIDEGEPEAWPNFEFVLRSVALDAGSAVNVIGVSESPPPEELAVGQRLELPHAGESLVAELLDEFFTEVEASLLSELVELGGGSLTAIRQLLEKGDVRGDFQDVGVGLRVRPGARPSTWVDAQSFFDTSAASAIDADGLQLFAALDLLGGRGDVEELEELADLDRSRFAGALQSSLEGGRLIWKFTPGKRAQLAATTPIEPRVLEELGGESLQALFGRRAKQLEVTGQRSWELGLARFAHRPTSTGFFEALDQLSRLRDAWRPELALQCARKLCRLCELVDPTRLARARAELAKAWAHLGQVERAEAELDALQVEGAQQPATLAAIERARGSLMHQRSAFAEAASCFERAHELDPEDGGESLFRRGMLAWERRAEAELDELCAALQEMGNGMHDTFRWNMEALQGLSLCRRGSLEEGLEVLRNQERRAAQSSDEARQAIACMNLGTALRDRGGLPEATELLERAASLQERQGNLPGIARARAMLGGTLRRMGRLSEACSSLRDAHDWRVRLGDESGAAAALGMLGLAHADSGALRSALDALRDAASKLRAGGRSTDALVLEARQHEVEARMDSGEASTNGMEQPAPDPRVLVSWARTQALRGDSAGAKESAKRAEALASKLGLEVIVAESRLLLARLDGLPLGESLVAGQSARLAAECRAWQFISQSPDEVEEGDWLARAKDFAQQGYIDLAARLAMRSQCHAQTEELANESFELARELLEDVQRGLTESESSRARRNLLGLPDPQPRDIESYEQARREGAVLDMDVISLLEVNQRLVAQEDVHTLLGVIVENALAVTHAERGFLMLEHGGEVEFDTARNSKRGDISDPELEVSSSVLTRVFEEGHSLRLSNASDDPIHAGAPSVENLELRSILVCPFVVDEELRGAIYVDHRLRENAFSDRAQRMLELLASQAALAIRQVRRLEEIRDLNGELNQRVHDREQKLARATEALDEAGLPLHVSELVGSSAPMQALRRLIDRLGKAEMPVLVCGASGTGKELAARSLHQASARADGPFVVENCAALPASLIESELFGFEKGAFTGADRRSQGIFERAHTGTLFLDEIGELPLGLQAKLLRVLETHEIRRVGGSKAIRADFRLIAATNRDLQLEVREGRFREDLMYRLDALRVDMPALAERLEDIPELVQHFLRLEAAQSGRPRSIREDVLAALCRRDWPGNVRELSNEVARLCVLSPGEIKDASLIRLPAPRASEVVRGIDGSAGGLPTMAELERQAIEEALRVTAGDKRKAAEMLGISRAKLYQRLKAWSEEAGTD